MFNKTGTLDSKEHYDSAYGFNAFSTVMAWLEQYSGTDQNGTKLSLFSIGIL